MSVFDVGFFLVGFFFFFPSSSEVWKRRKRAPFDFPLVRLWKTSHLEEHDRVVEERDLGWKEGREFSEIQVFLERAGLSSA